MVIVEIAGKHLRMVTDFDMSLFLIFQSLAVSGVGQEQAIFSPFQPTGVSPSAAGFMSYRIKGSLEEDIKTKETMSISEMRQYVNYYGY